MDEKKLRFLKKKHITRTKNSYTQSETRSAEKKVHLKNHPRLSLRDEILSSRSVLLRNNKNSFIRVSYNVLRGVYKIFSGDRFSENGAVIKGICLRSRVVDYPFARPLAAHRRPLSAHFRPEKGHQCLNSSVSWWEPTRPNSGRVSTFRSYTLTWTVSDFVLKMHQHVTKSNTKQNRVSEK